MPLCGKVWSYELESHNAVLQINILLS